MYIHYHQVLHVDSQVSLWKQHSHQEVVDLIRCTFMIAWYPGCSHTRQFLIACCKDKNGKEAVDECELQMSVLLQVSLV